MKTFPTKKVKDVLQNLGLKPQCKGNGSGHEVWTDATGKRCNPVFRHKDLSQGSLYALGSQLESVGLCKRQVFMNSVRSI